MRKIYFIRHAKAEPQSEISDFKRALCERGINDIEIMAKVLKSKDINPDLIVSSEALRCKDTAKRLVSAMKIKSKIAFDKDFYEADLSYLLKFIKGIKPECKELMLILHEPEIAQICEYISGAIIDKVPTCGVFCVEFECEFSEISSGCARALFFEFPKRYRKNNEKSKKCHKKLELLSYLA